MGEGDGGVSECEAGMLGAGRAEAKACHATVQEKALLILGGVCVRCVRGVRVEYALGQGKADLRYSKQAEKRPPCDDGGMGAVAARRCCVQDARTQGRKDAAPTTKQGVSRCVRRAGMRCMRKQQRT